MHHVKEDGSTGLTWADIMFKQWDAANEDFKMDTMDEIDSR